MKLGKYTLRKPWVKYVDIEFPEAIYKEIRASIVDDMIREAKDNAKYDIEILRHYREKD
jgi:hypothetical protein